MLEISVCATYQGVQCDRSMLIAGTAIFGSNQEHVFADEWSLNVVRIRYNSGCSIISPNISRCRPTAGKESLGLSIKPTEIRALQQIWTGIEVRIRKAAVNFPAVIVPYACECTGRRIAERSVCASRLWRLGLCVAAGAKSQDGDYNKGQTGKTRASQQKKTSTNPGSGTFL